MRFPLNWDPDKADASVDHTKHEASLTLTNPPTDIEDTLYVEFRDFAHFDGHHNDIAVVYGKHDEGVCHAMFDTCSFFGLASSTINPRVVPVRLWCDAKTRKAVGDTAGEHMLVGQRRWWVERAGNVLTLATEAYERPRNWLNRVGMFFGRSVQMKIWTAYLKNICAAYGQPAVVHKTGPTRAGKSPWPPEIPYPGCDCRI